MYPIMSSGMIERETIAEGFKGEKAIVTPYSTRRWQAANPITRGLYVTHIGYYPHAQFHYRKRMSGTNEHILILCSGGKGWVEYGGEKHVLSENMFFIIPARDAHVYGADLRDPWSIYWLHFQGENASMFDPIMRRPLLLEESDNNRHAARFELFENIYRNLEMGYSPENLEYISLCLGYFLASLKYVSQFRITNNVKIENVVEQSILYMKDNLENKTTLKDIADAVGYSASHLTALFIRKTTYSPIQYFNQLRIQRACSYLQFSELKIKEIAFKLCYYDPFHFSKAFIKEMGLTPREYRRRYNEKHKSAEE